MRQILNLVRSMISRAVVSARQGSGNYQVLWLDDRISADVELQEPQGVHFRAPANALGVLVNPGGDPSASVLLCASGDVPDDALEPGEGGLHLLGTYRVFCKADGSTLIGVKESATVSAAVAEYVDARFAALETIMNGHIHSGVTTGPGNSGPLVTPLVPGSSTASTKVKIEP